MQRNKGGKQSIETVPEQTQMPRCWTYKKKSYQIESIKNEIESIKNEKRKSNQNSGIEKYNN